MLMLLRRILLPLAACTILAACAAHESLTRARLDGRMQQADSFSLPLPAQLSERLRVPEHTASYVPSDLVRKGMNFDGSFPHPLASAQGESCRFEPDQPAGSPGLAGAAWAFYSYSLSAYDGPDRIIDSWNLPPASGCAWLGLANWDRNRWDWYPASGSGGATQLSALGPYITFNGGLLACVLLTGDSPRELSRLRIGGVAPVAQLDATPLYGRPPLSVTLDAGGSADPDGSMTLPWRLLTRFWYA